MDSLIKISIRAVLIWWCIMILSVIGFWVTNLQLPTFDPTEWEPDTRMVIYFSTLVSIWFGWITHIISD